jgi:hypothetical protein
MKSWLVADTKVASGLGRQHVNESLAGSTAGAATHLNVRSLTLIVISSSPGFLNIHVSIQPVLQVIVSLDLQSLSIGI